MTVVERCKYVIKLHTINTISFFVFVFLKAKAKLFIAKDNGIRILVYHSIAEVEKYKDPLRITVPPKLFENQIKYLISWGYKIISMDELLEYVCGNRANDNKEIVLTFDDGFDDNFIYAYNILKKNGLAATFFLTCSYINSRETFPWYGKGSLYNKPLTWEKILIMANDGMGIGSHTLTHINLCSASSDIEILNREIKASKDILEQKIKMPVNYFAYPLGCKGSYNKATEDVIRKSGYKAACTNIFGTNRKNENVFRLKRTRIDWNDTLFKFKMKIEGAFDWIDGLKFNA